MNENFILDFPVIATGGGDFDAVEYQVEAGRNSENLIITHKLTGKSFVRQLIENKVAGFSVLLVYRNSAERQHCMCETYDIESDVVITATQTVPKLFSYSPEVIPSIIATQAVEIPAKDALGVSDFWREVDFRIPQYARIARHDRLVFSDGEMFSLFQLEHAKEFESGQMRIEVNETAGEGQVPVTLFCARDLYDEMVKPVPDKNNPRDVAEAWRCAVVTHVLSYVYSYMHNLRNKTNDDAHKTEGVLAAHLELLLQETGTSWEDDDFNASLAATKMWRYSVEVIQQGGDDD